LAEFLTVAGFARATGEARQQFSNHGAADQQPFGTLHQLDAGEKAPLKPCVGIGIQGNSPHRLLPEFWVDLFKGGDGCAEGIAFLLRPSAS
jgi:hypothetical protein